jgi:segregation and condensation protein B
VKTKKKNNIITIGGNLEENFEKNLNKAQEEAHEKTEKNNFLEEIGSESQLSPEGRSIESQEGDVDLNSKLSKTRNDTKILDENSSKIQVRDFHRNLIEASLYAAGSPLTIEEISTKLEIPKKEVEELVNELAFDYLERTTALIIAQIGERFQMQIRPEYTEKVSQFAKGGAIAEKYLRTLTVIALKQPLLKSTLVKIRGTGAYEHVKYLINNGFLNAVKKGRSHELTTTDKYADMFGLPKDKTELKRAMITQLGIEEASSSSQFDENEDDNEDELYNTNQSIDDTTPSMEKKEEE